jgi:hypothetical protein
LFRAIGATYGVGDDVAAQKLVTLRIVHVYGSLGGALPGLPDYLPPAQGVDKRRVEQASLSLRVMPEHREDRRDDLDSAIGLLGHAERIAVLGFGFDRMNLERLKAAETLAPTKTVDDRGVHRKEILATCLGMTAAEAQEAGALCNIPNQAAVSETLPQGFYRTDCVGLLRETLILRRR